MDTCPDCEHAELLYGGQWYCDLYEVEVESDEHCPDFVEGEEEDA